MQASGDLVETAWLSATVESTMNRAPERKFTRNLLLKARVSETPNPVDPRP